MAEWMAKAFDKNDCYVFVLTGIKVRTVASDDLSHPRAANFIFRDSMMTIHTLTYPFFRAMLDRGSADGSILTNKTRTAARTIYRPGQPDNKLDLDWTSPKDENWNKFLDRCGGKDAFRSRHYSCRHFVHICSGITSY
jgi:hypothetical protein